MPVLHQSSCTGHGAAHGARVLAAAAAAAPASGTAPLPPSPAAPAAPDPPKPEAPAPLDANGSGQDGTGSSADSSSTPGLQEGFAAVAKPLPLPLETQPQARTSGLRRSWNTGSRAEWFAATIGGDLWDTPQDLDEEEDTGSPGGAQGAHRSRGSGRREAVQARSKGWGRDAERDRGADKGAGVSRGALGLQGASSSSAGGSGSSTEAAAARGGEGAGSLEPSAAVAGQRLGDEVIEGQGEANAGAQVENLPAGPGAAASGAAAATDLGAASLAEHEAAGAGGTAVAAGSGSGGAGEAGAADGAFNAAGADAEALLEAYVDPDMEWSRGRMDPERIRALQYIRWVGGVGEQGRVGGRGAVYWELRKDGRPRRGAPNKICGAYCGCTWPPYCLGSTVASAGQPAVPRRHLVLSQLRSSADARELVSAVDWTVPLMDLAGVAEALRMVRVAANVSEGELGFGGR